MNGKAFKTIFESFFPTQSAYDWDNVGLQIGTLNKDIRAIVVSLDLTMEVIDEAIEHKANLILVHHPLIFHPLNVIDTNSYLGAMIERLIQNEITLYVAHTNFDVAPLGMNLYLSNLLQLQDTRALDPISETESLGVIGSFETPHTLDELIERVKTAFELDTVRVISGSNTMYQTIALTGGSGSREIGKAIANNVDAYISGDITYHDALDAKNIGFTILDVGHNIEKHALQGLTSLLKENGVTCSIHVSTVDTNPYQTK